MSEQRTTIFDIIKDDGERQKIERNVREYRRKVIYNISGSGEFGEDEVLEMILRLYRQTDITSTEAIFLSWTVCKYLYTSNFYVRE